MTECRNSELRGNEELFQRIRSLTTEEVDYLVIGSKVQQTEQVIEFVASLSNVERIFLNHPRFEEKEMAIELGLKDRTFVIEGHWFSDDPSSVVLYIWDGPLRPALHVVGPGLSAHLRDYKK